MKMRHHVFLKYLLLFFLGGFLYGAIEIAFRGFSHISMFVAGGLCFLGIGGLNEVLPEDTSLTSQMLLSSVLVTVVEFTVGMIVNVWLGLEVWDYSEVPYNLYGQICLLYSIFWFFLSLPAILLDDYLRAKIFGEKKAKYKIF